MMPEQEASTPSGSGKWRHRLAPALVSAAFAWAISLGALNGTTLALLCVALGVLCARDLAEFLRGLPRHWRLLALFGWCCASLSWSVVPAITGPQIAYQAALLLTCLLMAFSVRDCDWAPPLRYAAMLGIGASVLYSALFYGAAQSADGLRGYFPHKNNLGATMAVATLMLLALPRRRMADYVFIAMGSALVILSLSATSTILIVVVPVLLALQRLFVAIRKRAPESYGTRAFLFMVRPLPWVLTMAALGLTLLREPITDLLLQVMSPELLTGRGTLWHLVLQRTSDKLLTGIGLGVFWSPEPGAEVTLTEFYLMNPLWVNVLAGADGGYVDVVGAIGFVGLSLMLLVIIDALTALAGDPRTDAPMRLVLVAAPAIHNLTETTFFLSMNLVWFGFVFAVALNKFRPAGGALRG